jgi:hypothetical protein
VGKLSSPEIRECSGLAISRKNPGILWAHNDSGDGPRLFAVDEGGSLRGTYHLAAATAVDWEDMARGPCKDPEKECLYVGDIGDNTRVRPMIQVYRVEEPHVPLQGPPVKASLGTTERFDCTYPDGIHDAETLLVDPATGIPYLVTKGPPGQTGVYRFPRRPTAGEVVVLERITILPSRSYVTGGDVSQDGSMIVLRGYLSAYGYPRPERGEFFEAFSSSPTTLPISQEGQGEAVGIAPSGTEIYTTGEGIEAPIHRAVCSLTSRP